jgi:hypothetical protein
MMETSSASGDGRAAGAQLKGKPADITLVDTHVHLHACYALERSLQAAYEHFVRASASWPGSTCSGVLCLAEDVGENAFERLVDRNPGSRIEAGPDDWTSLETEDPAALIVRSSSRGEMIVVAGRQCPTRDGIEILLPGRRTGPKPTCSFREAVESALEDEGPILIPWGFGKWSGRRRRLVAEVLQNADPGRVLLADSGNRPRVLPDPNLLTKARMAGRPVPAGSDPLPFKSEENRAGSYGTALHHKVLRSNPTRGVLRALQDADAHVGIFGDLESTARFVRNQVRMQLRKRQVPAGTYREERYSTGIRP